MGWHPMNFLRPVDNFLYQLAILRVSDKVTIRKGFNLIPRVFHSDFLKKQKPLLASVMLFSWHVYMYLMSASTFRRRVSDN
jgi:hypothetical protein